MIGNCYDLQNLNELILQFNILDRNIVLVIYRKFKRVSIRFFHKETTDFNKFTGSNNQLLVIVIMYKT